MTFKSKYHRHRLVMIPTVFKMNEWGQREAKVGKEIQFDNGLYKTTDPDEIRFLTSHKNFNIDFVGISEAPVSVFQDLEEETVKQNEINAARSERMKKLWADRKAAKQEVLVA